MDRLRNMLIFCLFVNKLFDKWMDLLACGLLDFDLVLIGYFTRKKDIQEVNRRCLYPPPLNYFINIMEYQFA